MSIWRSIICKCGNDGWTDVADNGVNKEVRLWCEKCDRQVILNQEPEKSKELKGVDDAFFKMMEEYQENQKQLNIFEIVKLKKWFNAKENGTFGRWFAADEFGEFRLNQWFDWAYEKSGGYKQVFSDLWREPHYSHPFNFARSETIVFLGEQQCLEILEKKFNEKYAVK